MNTQPQDAGDSAANLLIPPELHEAVARAERVLDFCRDCVFSLPPPSKDYCWHAGMALLHVMHDQLEAARLYAQEWPRRPFPVMILVRPIYEAMLQLLYLLRPDSGEERQRLGRLFLAFQAVNELAEIERAPGGVEDYKRRLSQNKARRFQRILEIAKEAEAQFTPAQERQLKRGRWNVTWTGHSIAELASELGEELHKFHVPWYGVMSMAAHVRPGMIPWAYDLPEDSRSAIEQVVRCLKQSTEWLNRGSVMAFLCTKAFLDKYDIELSDAGRKLDKEIAPVCEGSDERTQDEIALRNDPTIHELRERIVGAVHPLRIILFGSAVRGEIRTGSDFDVLVVMPEGTPLGPTENTLYRSMYGFCVPVDFIAVTEEEIRRAAGNRNVVVDTAVTEGKEIYRAA